ncbi:uncharacterized protein BDV17DRAFT_4594 [Aspergillus undulatus]|uniref:uncharacterized protein n=1 Tax=Aspergillus undulatus TaxID=1810928 RepID=UPI003CCDFEB0
MRSALFLASCLAACSAAAPIFENFYDFSDDMAEFLGRVSKRISDAGLNFDSIRSCDTSSIHLPSFAEGLPAPNGQKPLYVALGRGTQNYTCATSTADSEPVAVGAVARLYNATCFAASYPEMIELLPAITYRMSLPTEEANPLPPTNLNLIGHHFFEGSVPVFNMDTTPTRQLGIAKVKKDGDLDAPTTALQGENGAVPWLLLGRTNGTVGAYSSVYRVDTAGGASPKTCEGMEEEFTVEYAANYYMYRQ